MPPSVVESLLAGLAVEAVVTAVKGASLLAKRLSPSERRRVRDPSALVDCNALTARIVNALGDVARDTDAATSQALERLRETLSAPTLRRLVEWKAAEVQDSAFISLREDFMVTGRLYLGGDDHVLLAAFGVLDEVAQIAVAAARGANLALEQNVMARIRSDVSAVQLAAIERHLRLLREQTAPPLAEFEEMAQRLREQVRFRHREITPPDFERQRRVPIDSLYVTPHVYPFVNGHKEHFDAVTVMGLLAGEHRSVVLGAPGGGKSTMANWICHRLASTDGAPAPSTPLPFFITTRDFAEQVDRSRQSIVEYIVETADYKYQVPVSTTMIEHMLAGGRLLPIFDGLDELLDTSTRRDIVASIESFAVAFPFTPILVTSREVGYEQAPLDDSYFDTYALAEFDDGQVESYAIQWFWLQDQLPERERTALSDSFLRDSTTVPDLRRNPLLLSLMCLLYRGHRHIPQYRPEVYESCAQLLLKDWDRHRRIFPDVPLESHVDDCIQHLAGWIFGTERERGVREADLLDELSSYIHEWVISDTKSARVAAEGIVKYCKGRAWILSEVGAEVGRAGLFQFTHRTFLEYFAALDLVRSHATSAELTTEVLRHIGDQPWYLVAQIAIYRKNRDTRGAVDEILPRVIGWYERKPRRFDPKRVAFAVDMLQLVTPRPATTKKVVSAAVTTDAQQQRRGSEPFTGSEARQREPTLFRRVAVPDSPHDADHRVYSTVFGVERRAAAHEVTGQEAMAGLLDAREENLTSVLETLVTEIRRLASSSRYGPPAVVALVDELAQLARSQRAVKLLGSVRDSVAPILSDYVMRLGGAAVAQAAEFVASGLLSLRQAVGLHGLPVAFTAYRDYRSVLRFPLAIELSLVACERWSISDALVGDLATLGELCVAVPAPWVTVAELDVDSWSTQIENFAVALGRSRISVGISTAPVLSDDVFAGLAIVLCVVEELSAKSGGQALSVLCDNLPGDVDAVRGIWRMRCGSGPEIDSTEFRTMLGIGPKQADVLYRWARRHVEFVDVEGSGAGDPGSI